MQGRGIFSCKLSRWLLVPFKWRVHCKEILNTDVITPETNHCPCSNASLLKFPCEKDLYPKDGLRDSTLRIDSGVFLIWVIQLTWSRIETRTFFSLLLYVC